MNSLRNENTIIERQRKVFEFIKKKTNWIIYILLAMIIFIASWIRTRNLSSLRDITTSGWTLGPDLDPFLFLRWAKEIVENGSLYAVDNMRYFPLGLKTGLEYPLIHYPIAWLHKLINVFGNFSVEQSAVIYPVIMFGLTVIGFFLMTRETFLFAVGKRKASLMALVACLFLSVMSVFIPRTIAGIPEKESAAFFYMFMAFYFFLLGWRQELKNKQYIYSSIGGLFAGLMALTWGGYGYILLTMCLIILSLFLFGQINSRRFASYGLFIFFLYMMGFIFLPERFTIKLLFTSVEGFATTVTFAILASDFILHRYFEKYVLKYLRSCPRIASIIYGGIVFLLIGTLFFGPSFIISKLSVFYSLLGQSADSRLIQTVAENRQPFFIEWSQNFGPMLKNIPILIPIIFLSSILMMYHILLRISLSKKERFILTGAWAFLIWAIAFTRYSPESVFRGSGFVSTSTYLLSIFLIFAAFIFVKREVLNRGETNPYLDIQLTSVFMQIFFVIGLLSSRTFIRLVLILAPMASMLIGYIFVLSCNRVMDSIIKKNILTVRMLVCSAIMVLVVFAGYSHYSSSVSLAKNYAPSVYTQQWQKAMSWVRENTPENAVFGHWWDYGYWVQSMGERATVLDGGNIMGYWNHLMGRYGLTGTDFSKTLDFFYAHNVSHFLIDSTDIGKYGAFSSIGSNSSYDRKSWIPTLILDNSQTLQRKNVTSYIYPGGFSLDQDIFYENNGSLLFLPAEKSYVAGIIVDTEKINNSIVGVSGIFVFEGKNVQIPLRYYGDEKTGLIDTKKGIESGIFLFGRVYQDSTKGPIFDERGALLFLSSKTVNSNLAKFYLFGQKNENFKLVHTEPDMFITYLRSQGANLGEFLYYNEFRGPIKIWGVNYPIDITLKEEYLKTEYPQDILLV